MPRDDVDRLLARIRQRKPSALEEAHVEACSLREFAESVEGVSPVFRDKLSQLTVTLRRAIAELREGRDATD